MIESNGKSQLIDRHGNRCNRGLTVWFTGLSGAGKTTICLGVYNRFRTLGLPAEVLDGDVLRTTLNCDLGFSKDDRDENVRRIGFIADLLTRHGVVALVAAISPHRSVREELKRAIGDFLEVYVNAPLGVCEQRDRKGLYKKARAGLLQEFTGISAPYEPPLAPGLECRTHQESITECVDKAVSEILKRLNRRVGSEAKMSKDVSRTG